MVVEQCYLVEELGGFGQLSIAEERSQELEEVNQQLMKEGPPLHTEKRKREGWFKSPSSIILHSNGLTGGMRILHTLTNLKVSLSCE